METENAENKLVLAALVRWEGDLLRRAVQLTGTETEARDLVQDTALRVLRAARVPPALDEFRPWMMRMLTNLWVDRVRSIRRRRAVPLSDSVIVARGPGEEPSADGYLDLSISDVTSAVSQLPTALRSAYRMHALGGRSYHSLAGELGVPAGTIASRIHRARRCLRRLLEGRIPEKTRQPEPEAA